MDGSLCPFPCRTSGPPSFIASVKKPQGTKGHFCNSAQENLGPPTTTFNRSQPRPGGGVSCVSPLSGASCSFACRQLTEGTYQPLARALSSPRSRPCTSQSQDLRAAAEGVDSSSGGPHPCERYSEFLISPWISTDVRGLGLLRFSSNTPYTPAFRPKFSFYVFFQICPPASRSQFKLFHFCILAIFVTLYYQSCKFFPEPIALQTIYIFLN